MIVGLPISIILQSLDKNFCISSDELTHRYVSQASDVI